MKKRRPKLNIIDRVVSFFSPAAGVRRQVARGMLASTSYNSTAPGRRTMKSYNTSGGDANHDTLNDLDELRRQSRQLARNNSIAAGALRTKVTNVVGLGLLPAPAIDMATLQITPEEAEKIGKSMEKAWATHANSKTFSASRKHNARQLALLAFRARLESGDVLLLKRFLTRPDALYSTCWQLIEADRLSNPNRQMDGQPNPLIKDGMNKINGGVECNHYGEPVAFWVANNHPGSWTGGATLWDRIKARDPEGRIQAIHLTKETRPDQARSVPDLTPVIEPLAQYGKYSHAELDAAVTGACMSLAITSESGEGVSTNNPSLSTLEDDAEDDEIIMAPNEAFYLRPGEDVKQVKAEHPSTAYEPFVLAIFRQIGTALGLPFEVLMKHYQSSYSAARAAILDAWSYFMQERADLADDLYQVWYEAAMWEAASREYIELPGFLESKLARVAYLKTVWQGTAMPQIDPKKQAEAAAFKIEKLLSTYADESPAITGRPWAETIERRAREKEVIQHLGLAEPEALGTEQENQEPDAEEQDALDNAARE